MKSTAEKWNLSDISLPLTNQYAITLISLVAVKKVKYRADWSEWTNRLTITLFHLVHNEKKYNTPLIGQSGAHELLQQNHWNDENWI